MNIIEQIDARFKTPDGEYFRPYWTKSITVAEWQQIKAELVLEGQFKNVEALESCYEWLKDQELTINVGPVDGPEYGEAHVESTAGWLFRMVGALLDRTRALKDGE